jgi:PEP-CTERM motif
MNREMMAVSLLATMACSIATNADAAVTINSTYSVSATANGANVSYSDRTIASVANLTNPGVYTNLGSASADLSQASLRAFVSSNGSGLNASAIFRDTISFGFTGQSFAFLLPVTWHFNGKTNLLNGNFAANGGFAVNEDNGRGGVLSFQRSIQGAQGASTINDVQSGSFLVNPGFTYSVGGDLFISMGGKGFADFGNTSYVTFDLPSGVFINSASGAFLNNQISSAVPEPANWAMMIVGFGLVGGAMRRRQSVRVTYA